MLPGIHVANVSALFPPQKGEGMSAKRKLALAIPCGLFDSNCLFFLGVDHHNISSTYRMHFHHFSFASL